MTDVTAGKLAGEMIRESEARFRALFSAIDEGYCLREMVTDSNGRSVDYRFLEADPLVTDMTGLVEPVGRTARELVPDLEDDWIQTYGAVAFGGEPLRESEASERRARQQAELIAEIEAVDGFDRRARHLAEMLVPRVADAAAVVLPGDEGPAGVDRAGGEELTPTRCAVSIETGADEPASLVLSSGDPDRRAFTDDDLRFARRIADRVGVVFARTRVREEERRIALRLQEELRPDEVL